MKTKIYKLLSILVTLAILATTCLCVFGTVSAAVQDTPAYQDVIFEHGGIADEDGSNSEAELSLVRTQGYLKIADYDKIEIGEGHIIDVIMYSDNAGTRVNSSGWLAGGVDYTAEEMLAAAPGATHFRFQIKDAVDGNSEININDLAAIGLNLVAAQAPIVYPENSYFISAKGKAVPSGKRPAGAGTLENPVKTFSDVTRLIEADGYGAGDTVYVFIKSGEKVNWTDDANLPVPYTCDVILDSTNPNVLGKLYEYDFMDLVGNITFKNVEFQVEYMYGYLRLNHYDVIFDKGSVVNLPELYIGAKNAPAKHNKEFNLEIRGQFKVGKFYIMSYFKSGTYEKDINILVDNPDATLPLLVTGIGENNNFTFNGNININLLNAKSMSLNKSLGTSTFNGAFQLIISNEINLPYSVKTNFENLKVGGGKWLITRNTKDPDFIQFGSAAGKFDIKNKATAYIRQLGGKLITDKDGVVDLSKSSGAYTISDKPIDELLDDSHKMLYFKCGGGTNNLVSFADIEPGETYRFEYSIYASHFDDSYPTCREDHDRKPMGNDMKVISKKAYKNYYKVVAEITIPETYPYEYAFFGVSLAPSSMGVIFDRNVYNVKDPKTNLIKNPKLHTGLDDITLNFDFWGGVFTDSRGGSGLLEWTNGVIDLAVMSVDSKFIDHLIYLADPDDGEWWNPEDYIEENYDTYADVVGSFKDQDGNPIKGVKFLLVSQDNSYDTKTNAKGEFSFKKILTGFYDLYFVDGKKKIETGFSSYIGQDDIVIFDVVSDLTSMLEEIQNSQVEEIVPEEEEEEEIIPTGNFAATVYNARLDTIAGLKVVLGDIGDVVTDANGSFAFANIPVGTYELYTVLNDGTKYVLKQVVIEENRDITSKLKFDPVVDSDNTNPTDNGWIVWVIVASAVALVVVAGLIFLLVFKKKAA